MSSEQAQISSLFQAGVQRVRANFSSQVKKGKLTEEKLEALMKKLHGTVTYDKFKSVDMVRRLGSDIPELQHHRSVENMLF